MCKMEIILEAAQRVCEHVHETSCSGPTCNVGLAQLLKCHQVTPGCFPQKKPTTSWTFMGGDSISSRQLHSILSPSYFLGHQFDCYYCLEGRT